LPNVSLPLGAFEDVLPRSFRHDNNRGHLHQGRFKAFPVQEGEHLHSVCRYVERNALSAGVVEHAQDWRWSSLWARREGDDSLKGLLSDWPVERP
jgi:putative transposase